MSEKIEKYDWGPLFWGAHYMNAVGFRAFIRTLHQSADPAEIELLYLKNTTETSFAQN